LATLVAMTKKIADEQPSKDVAMQVAAMAPVAVSKETIPQSIIDKELEIGRAIALEEGKPAAIVDKIAEGKLGKFFKENTLLSQDFIKDHKTSVADYLKSADKDLSVIDFVRFTLND
jgi:elongation factor Ts